MANDFSKRCFVIMPFGKDESEESKWTARYRELIELAVLKSELGLETQRVDSLDRPGGIPEEIFRNLEHSRFVIADLSGENQNVAYELGVRHARKHGTILIAEKGTALPFDFSKENVIFFPDDVVGRQKATDRIVKRLKGIASDPKHEDSPFFRAVSDQIPSVTFNTLKRNNLRRKIGEDTMISRTLDVLAAMRADYVGDESYGAFFRAYLIPVNANDSQAVHDVYVIAKVLTNRGTVPEYMSSFAQGIDALQSTFVYTLPSTGVGSPVHGETRNLLSDTMSKLIMIIPVLRKNVDRMRLVQNAGHHFEERKRHGQFPTFNLLENFTISDGTAEVRIWDITALEMLEKELHLK